MEFNKNDIEYYLLTKEYSSLTKEELIIVSEAVETEAEYDALRQLLLVMEEAPVEELLVPKPEVKESLIATFEKARWEKGVTTSTSAKVVDLKEDNGRKKNGFIWLSIAASLALLVGLFLTKDNFINDTDNQMAQLEQELVKQTNELEEVGSVKEVTTNTSKVVETEIEKKSDILEGNKEQIDEDVPNEIKDLSRDEEVIDEFNDLIIIEQFEKEASPNIGEVETESKITTTDKFASKKTNAISDMSMDKEMLAETVNLDDVTLTKDSYYGNASSISQSVSLKDDKELLSLLYTAL